MARRCRRGGAFVSRLLLPRRLCHTIWERSPERFSQSVRARRQPLWRLAGTHRARRDRLDSRLDPAKEVLAAHRIDDDFGLRAGRPKLGRGQICDRSSAAFHAHRRWMVRSAHGLRPQFLSVRAHQRVCRVFPGACFCETAHRRRRSGFSASGRAGAHHFSDVVASMIVGVLAAYFVRRILWRDEDYRLVPSPASK